MNIPIIGERLATVTVNPQALQQLMTPAPVASMCVQGLPADAQLVAVQAHPQTGMIQLLFKHDSFPPRMADGRIAEVAVTLQAIPVQVQQPEQSPIDVEPQAPIPLRRH